MAIVGSPNAGLLEETQQQDPQAPHENGAAARASDDDDDEVPMNATSSKAGTNPAKTIAPHEPNIWRVRDLGRNSSARRRNERVSQPSLRRESSVARRSARRRKTTASESNRAYGAEFKGRTSGDSGGGGGDGDGTEKVGAKPHHLQVLKKNPLLFNYLGTTLGVNVRTGLCSCLYPNGPYISAQSGVF